MTSILIRNAHLITLDSQDRVLPSADIAISDGAILWWARRLIISNPPRS